MDAPGGSLADDLPGTTWHATSLAGAEVVEGHRPEITFDPAGSLFGSTGVNRLRGSYTITGDSVLVSQLATTMMASEPAAMAQEQVVLRLLEQTLAAVVEQDVLRLDGAAGSSTWGRGEAPILL